MIVKNRDGQFILSSIISSHLHADATPTCQTTINRRKSPAGSLDRDHSSESGRTR